MGINVHGSWWSMIVMMVVDQAILLYDDYITNG